MIGGKGGWRRLRMGLQTLLGLRRQGYFLPYRYADQVPPPETAGGYPELHPWFRAAEPEMAALLQVMETHEAALRAIPRCASAGKGPRWGQDWFPGLDAAALYALIRQGQPRRVLEVGSGHSTRFALRAVADGALAATEVTAIDPQPRADLAEAAGSGRLRLKQQTLQQVGLGVFGALEAGDLLLIDSSHLLVQGSDVDLLLNRVLPVLPAGVRVQIHDILLPDAYPPDWGWRGYAEASAVAPLIHGGGWRILFSSAWIRRHAALPLPAVIRDLPLNPGAIETALWLEKIVRPLPGKD